ncbi:hypothetical protein C8R44DRAFT_896376 [Mycena epipterygia]|nr:hypothetical protein C8R44DRAFT_896376 [Mycena epipterygia]
MDNTTTLSAPGTPPAVLAVTPPFNTPGCTAAPTPSLPPDEERCATTLPPPGPRDGAATAPSTGPGDGPTSLPAPQPAPQGVSTGPPVWCHPEVLPRVVEYEAEKCRHRKSDGPKKPGKVSWVYGTKLVFFSCYKDVWLAAAEKKTTGALYTKLAKLYTLKYSFDMKDNKDFETDFEDPPDEAADGIVHGLVPEEAKWQSDYKEALCMRIGAWLRSQYGTLLKEDKTAFAELFTGPLDGAPGKPQHGQLVQFYESHVRARADARIQTLKCRAELSGEPAPTLIKTSNEVTKECWDEESPSFREEVQVAFEKEYQAAVKAWEVSLVDSPTRTPEEFAA